MIEKIKNFWNKGAWQKVLIVFVVLMIIGLVVPADEEETAANEPKTEEKATSEKTTDKKEKTEKKEKEDKKVALGKSAKAGMFEYKFNSVTKQKVLGDPNMLGAKANGEFVVVKVSVKNVEDKAHMFSEGSIKLICDGKEYNTSSEASTYFMGQNDELFVGEINPDITKTGSIAFDVPSKVANSKNCYIQIDNGWEEPVKFELK